MSHIYPHGWHRDAVSRQHDNDIKSPAAKKFLALRQKRRQGEGGAKPEARKPETRNKLRNRKRGKSKTGSLISLVSSLDFEFVSDCPAAPAQRRVLRISCLPLALSPLHLVTPGRFPKRQPRLVHVRVDLEELVESDKVQ